MLNAKQIQDEARKELFEEATEVAKDKLKELYTKREKAALVVRNIDREIQGYLESVGEMTTYEAAGVDTTKN